MSCFSFISKTVLSKNLIQALRKTKVSVLAKFLFEMLLLCGQSYPRKKGVVLTKFLFEISTPSFSILLNTKQ
jgi:hypothetical protein